MADGGDSMTPLEKALARRRKAFKASLDPTEARARREKATVQVRKQKREQQLAKRRAQAAGSSPPVMAAATTGSSTTRYEGSTTGTRGGGKEEVDGSMMAMEMHAGMLMSEDLHEKLDAATYYRKLLSMEDPPLDLSLEMEVPVKLVDCLDMRWGPDVHFEALWALTNIASGDTVHTKSIVEAAGVPAIMSLLRDSPDLKVREQGVWALGNVAGEGQSYRDMVIHHDGVDVLVSQVEGERTPPAMLRNVAWALSNLCRGRPAAPIAELRNAVNCLARIVTEMDDRDARVDATWALSYVSDGKPERVQAVLDTGIINELVSALTRTDDLPVLTPALRTVGNIATGEHDQTQQVINAGGLEALVELLHNRHRAIVKEACWTLSNVTAGTREQIDACIDGGVIGALISLCDENVSTDVRKEACWAISNATAGGSADQLYRIWKAGAVRPLAHVIKFEHSLMLEERVLAVCMEGIQNMLDAGKLLDREGNAHGYEISVDPEILSLGPSFMALCGSSRDLVSRRAATIVANHFPTDDDDGGGDYDGGDYDDDVGADEYSKKY